jgi:hypothetical protein
MRKPISAENVGPRLMRAGELISLLRTELASAMLASLKKRLDRRAPGMIGQTESAHFFANHPRRVIDSPSCGFTIEFRII